MLSRDAVAGKHAGLDGDNTPMPSDDRPPEITRRCPVSVKNLLHDAATLYRDRRYLSSFTLALIALEATARTRYPGLKSSAKRFKTFLNDEAKTSNMFKIRLGVDLPPVPTIAEAPEFRPPPIKDDDYTDLGRRVKEWVRKCNKWKAETDRAYHHYSKVGDDFRGPKGSYMGKPRLVTMTGIIYQARCELVHEANLATIRVVDHDNGFMVSGSNPITFSSSYITAVLAIVVLAQENVSLFRPNRGG